MEELKWEEIPKKKEWYKSIIYYLNSNVFENITRGSYILKFKKSFMYAKYGTKYSLFSNVNNTKLQNRLGHAFNDLLLSGYIVKIKFKYYELSPKGRLLINNYNDSIWEEVDLKIKECKNNINLLKKNDLKKKDMELPIIIETPALISLHQKPGINKMVVPAWVHLQKIIKIIPSRDDLKIISDNTITTIEFYFMNYLTNERPSIPDVKKSDIKARIYYALQFLINNQYLEEIFKGVHILNKKGIALSEVIDMDWHALYEKEIDFKIIDDNYIGVSKKTRRNDEELMYPMLTEYLEDTFDLKSMRIDEKKSKNKRGQGGNTWLHPDIVALQPINSELSQMVKNCISNNNSQKIKLWSFEVKLELTISNVRKCFFQAVSNSSWANEGYLVTNNIKDEATANELRMLSSLHGIGVIVLNTNNPKDSSIKLQATSKSDIDWKSVDRIVIENKDFEDYIESVDTYLQTGKVRDGDWD